MNATMTYQPYRLPAGVLALAVHAMFFALLYFGFTWQSQAVRTVSVELWSSLPERDVAPPEVPQKLTAASQETKAIQPPQPTQPAQPEPIMKPDIVIPDKKADKKIDPKPEPAKPEIQKTVKVKIQPEAEQPIARIFAERDRNELLAEQQLALVAQQRAEQVARERVAQESALNAVVDEYRARIINKIRGNIVKPPDVRDDAQAEFMVTLLPGGSVMSAELKKTSGNPAYDNAVERAILKSQPLPLPPDVSLFKKFRDLKMTFKPAE